ncbi:hypothetical protein FOCG_14094 [Fusarium oxysporum f. sp. radicis-lycopersici 26381]|nr:hypothetical protein FOZG_01706 [Fusarium oxysporum Fo47]EWZ87225.1 hypothetical protein FOWG_10588 [Fusarium oxysporum f. sp. lycopersici MN25]EXL43773.1 hypothetical protein FOCG_14094 [Fusarium oxysporum f. sp. radicis-lycopersici 26381]KAJ4126275.1 hypothetical protein NW765_002058 [Fusarium oxysporum]EWZ51734.1 hypothetical protein FOZG_01706 [Fusarium oxysporum Fo47]
MSTAAASSATYHQPSTSAAAAATATGSSSSSSSSLSPRPPTSPPPTIASPSVAHAHAHAQIPSAAQQTSPPPPQLQPTLPSAETQRHVAEARRAVVATLENMMDSELQWRASTLHSNAAALSKQAQDVQRATEGLRRENVKLAREADAAARRLKELGNVQNWAEVLERDFLVLEETVRLANTDRSCSCSECGSYTGSESDGGDVDEDQRAMKLGQEERGTDVEGRKTLGVEMDIDTENHAPGTFSDASRSLTEADSSVGKGAKGSDTASMSTISR